MTDAAKATVVAVAPYAVWMGLMSVLPSTAAGYAVRAAAALATLAAALFVARNPTAHPTPPLPHSPTPSLPHSPTPPLPAAPTQTLKHSNTQTLLSGTLVGLLVCILWIWPERFAWYRDFSVLGALGLAGESAAAAPSPYDPAQCGWALTWAKLAGSAFVIAPVEELFFRSFLYRWLQKGDWTKVPLSRFDLSAFLWTVGIFALEHHTRLAAGAMAGAAYGLLAVRRGTSAAIVAHVVTNLLLGLYVIKYGAWGFW